MGHDFFSAMKARRSVYTLSKKASVSDDQVQELIKDAVMFAPSPFNSQSGRTVLLLGSAHDELWSATKEILRGLVSDKDAFAQTEVRLDGFSAAYGTVLFFEDQAIVKGLQEQFALYKDKFPDWSLNSTGMLQYLVWTSFAVKGMGASLQHYNPLIDEWVYKKTGVPTTWKLIAQMPFGVPTAPAGEKTFAPIEERFKVVR